MTRSTRKTLLLAARVLLRVIALLAGIFRFIQLYNFASPRNLPSSEFFAVILGLAFVGMGLHLERIAEIAWFLGAGIVYLAAFTYAKITAPMLVQSPSQVLLFKYSVGVLIFLMVSLLWTALAPGPKFAMYPRRGVFQLAGLLLALFCAADIIQMLKFIIEIKNVSTQSAFNEFANPALSLSLIIYLLAIYRTSLRGITTAPGGQGHEFLKQGRP